MGVPLVVIKTNYLHASTSRYSRSTKKVWECEDYFPLNSDKDLDPKEIKLVLVDNYEGFFAPCVKIAQGELHEEVLQTLEYLKDSQNYCKLVLDMVPDSTLRSAFILMHEHVSTALALGQSADCAAGTAKLALNQPPLGVPGSSTSSNTPAKRKRRFSSTIVTAAQAEGLVSGPPIQPPLAPPPTLPTDLTGQDEATGGPPPPPDVGEGEEEYYEPQPGECPWDPNKPDPVIPGGKYHNMEIIVYWQSTTML